MSYKYELKKLVEVAGRIADELEKLNNNDPVVQMEGGPPVCPHCGQFDPMVEMTEEGSSEGPLSQVVIQVKCLKCNNTSYGVIESYSMHRTIETAAEEIQQREEGGFFKNG